MVEKPSIQFCMFTSPIGDLRLFAEQDALIYIQLPESTPLRAELYLRRYYPGHEITASDSPILEQTRVELLDYFDHPCRPISFTVPYRFFGTEFQHQVWSKIAEIPYGKVITYAELAQWCKRGKRFARSIGAGCGANPLPIIVPCHRVVGTNRKLTGFGGGLDVKEWLLCHEGNEVQDRSFLGTFLNEAF
ncbi:MAG: methylated-DNA--[Clostridia bacterium]|nr:methylated-DNA--[protein]-cysteine S-methyltransferase [Clostridia bacterium]